jgi:NADH:ubiquinone oxidoreductase subunit 4 (subunit M)/predicted  nucleic acid-binding Zn-ribbon protein
MSEIDMLWMTAVVFIPSLFALGVLFFPRGWEEAMRWWALFGTALTLGASICMFILFKYNTLDQQGVLNNKESRHKASLLYRAGEAESGKVGAAANSEDWVARYPWIKRFNIDYYLGADGISMPLVLLTTALCFLAMIASWKIEKFVKGYCVLFLVLETGMLGTFLALDFFLFYIFWEVMLLPMYFLIGIWGGPRREYAAIKFFLYTLLGSVFILIALLAFYFTNVRDFVPAERLAEEADRMNVASFEKTKLKLSAALGEFDRADNALRGLDKPLEDATAELKKAEDKLNKAEDELKKLKGRVPESEERVKGAEKDLNVAEALFKQETDAGKKKELEKKVKEAQEKKDAAEKKLKEAREAFGKVQSRIAELTKAREQAQKEAKAAKKAWDEAELAQARAGLARDAAEIKLAQERLQLPVVINSFDLILLQRVGKAALEKLNGKDPTQVASVEQAKAALKKYQAELKKREGKGSELEQAAASNVAAAEANVQAAQEGLKTRLEQDFFKPWFQYTMFLFLFIGFAIKVPVFPFHTWLPDAHVEAPTPISMILAGVLLKLGGYGIIRVAYPICPWAAEQLAWWVALFGVINIVYGAFAAMAQTDFKKLVAYSSVSHMGYVILGIAVWSAADKSQYWSWGMNGAMFQMIAHGITSAGMFFLVGVIYDRAHHRNLDNFRGLYEPMPLYGGISAVIFFAAMGLPGMCGFVGEFMVVLATWGYNKTFAVLAALTVVLTAAYILWTLQRVFMGQNPQYKNYSDISVRELVCIIPLVVLAVLLGVLPALLLNWMEPSVTGLIDTLASLK